MNIKQNGVMMRSPQRWNAAKVGNGSQLGWSWGDIGSGLLSIGKWGVNTFVSSQQKETYKTLYEQQQAASTQFVNKLITIGVVTAVGVLAYKALRG